MTEQTLQALAGSSSGKELQRHGSPEPTPRPQVPEESHTPMILNRQTTAPTSC